MRSQPEIGPGCRVSLGQRAPPAQTGERAVFHSSAVAEELSTGWLYLALPRGVIHHIPGMRTRIWAALLALGLVAPTLTPATALAAGPPPLSPPVPGGVERAYDPPEERWQAGHRGVDLAAPPGQAVSAAAPGRVVFAGMVAGRPVLSIEHDGGYRTTYEPVRAGVSVGTQVSAGQPVGTVEAGHGCACLHLGLKLGEDYRDPTPLLSATGGMAAGPVRLLPADAKPAPPPPPMSADPGFPMAGFSQQPGAHGLVRPSGGPLTSRFGMRLHPILHRWKLHDGADFGAQCDAPVSAAAAGRVVLVEANIAYGNRVVVEHGSLGGRRLRTSYNHLSVAQVSAGQVLRQGQLLGRVGSTGYSTACHLHFMVWADGAVTDPMGML